MHVHNMFLSHIKIVLLVFNLKAIPNVKTDNDPNIRPVFCGIQSSSDRFLNGCYFTNTHENLLIIAEEKRAILENNIFFIDASCSGGLSLRDACAIESAARHHPYRQISVLFLGSVSTACFNWWPIKELTQFLNVKLYRVHLNQFLKGTPLSYFVSDGMYNQSLYPAHHMAELLKYVTLYKYGGIYLDLDVIVAKTFDDLPITLDFAGKEDGDTVGTAVLGLSRTGIGNLIAREVVNILLDKFRPHVWDMNDKGILADVLDRVCGNITLNFMSRYKCSGFQLYEPENFYPIPSRNYTKYFTSFSGRLPKDSFAFHTWNNYTHSSTVRRGSLIWQLMEKNCPSVFQGYGKLKLKY